MKQSRATESTFDGYWFVASPPRNDQLLGVNTSDDVLHRPWRSDGCELGFGAGIAQGYATLGQIGFSERSGYTAIGTVCNLAARLCAEAKDGQILVSSRIARAVGAVARLENL